MTRVKPWWGYARLREELDGAVGAVAQLELLPELNARNTQRLNDWREFECQLRDRMTVLGINAELDAMGAK